MNPLRTLTIPEQLAEHLRREVAAGRLRGVMPGVLRLEQQTGVNRKTVEAALRLLEREGVLAAQGVGRRRRIVQPEGRRTGNALRVAVLLFEREDRGANYLLEIEHKLAEAGHEVVYGPRSLMELGMRAEQVARMVARTRADAWIVQAASREVLEWFAGRELPVMAVFGRRRTLPIAGVGPDKIPAIRAATRVLIGLGHRRIVFLTRRVNRLPEPGPVMRAFLDELAAHGIDRGPYHLPDWEESVQGLDERLESLHRVTPPTAMIVDEAPLFVAVRHFLGRLGLAVPEDSSLVCTDDDPAFTWCTPPVSHIRWDRARVPRRVAQWVSRVSRGKQDLRQTIIPAEFVPGGTIGPVRGR